MSAPQQKVFTADQVAHYRRVFNMFDINKNGVIESEELEAVRRLLASLQLRGGSMTFDQFLQSMPGYQTMQQAQVQPVQVAPIQPQQVQMAHHAPPPQAAPAGAPAPGSQRYAHLTEMFRKFDKDNNGFISLEEAHSVLAHVLGTTFEKTKELVRQFDVNNDGRLSYNEFVAFYSKIENLRAQIDAAFHEFDKDNKGYVTVNDAKIIMGRFGLSGPEVESLVKFHDANRDGKLQYNEFKQFWTSRGGIMGQIAVGTGAPGAVPAGGPAPVAYAGPPPPGVHHVHAPGQEGVPYRAPPVSGTNRQQQMMEKFRQFDRDGNGYISVDEAQIVMKRDLGFTPDQTADLVRQFDVNHDGRLSYNEFIAFYCRVENVQSQIDAAFRQFDRDNKGYVTVHDAKAILRNYGFSDFEIEGLVRIHDKNKDGKLQYHEFTQFWTGSAGQMMPGSTPSAVMGQQTFAAQPVAHQPAVHQAPMATQDYPMAHQTQVQGAPSSRHQQIQAAFRQFDRDGNGFITLDEAQIVLSKMLGFSGDKTKELVRQFDVNRDGRLSYNEFVAFYSKVEQRKKAIQDAFNRFDVGNKGFITVDDAKNVMRNFGFSDLEIEGLVQMHDTNRDGKLQYSEFVRFWNV